MGGSTSKKITKTASIMIILVLLIGGAIYLRTVSNAESLDNRNLRELSRIGQGVEGRINNLRRVVKNLAGEEDSVLIKKANLIPHLNIVSKNNSLSQEINNLTSGRTAFKTNVATDSLELWHVHKSTKKDTLRAAYSLESLRPTLSSEYMETIFLADEKGGIFIWETNRTGVRIHELAALDTLQINKDPEAGGIGKSDIIQTSIAGQEYRFYLLPIRIHISDIRQDSVSDTGYTKWILGGLVQTTDYSQQSLSLDPNMALFLGFLVIGGFLIVPFVRIFTMGPKERLKVGNLFYLVLALIFGTGLAGLWLADMVHFAPLKEDVTTQLKETADQMALNIDRELMFAIEELEKKTAALNNDLSDAGLTIYDIKKDIDKDSLYLMKDNISFDESGTYPFYQMVFWSDSDGDQLAKWTPRGNNTPRINVSQRDYFKAIHENRGWDQTFHTVPGSPTCSKMDVSNPGSLPYYIESIRSWNTGENLAAISIPWNYKNSENEIKKGVAAMTTKLASLTTPVLPAGVGFAIFDADAQTLFHSRPERILDENFAEETGNVDLLRSILAARSCTELEMSYEGQNKLMAIRPLNGRPLYLVLFKDLALIDTVRFEAWFEGGTLFGLWVFMILLLIFFIERLPKSRMDWMWPDLENPGKYTIFTIYSFPFIVFFIAQALTEEHLHIHFTTLIIPVVYLSLGLVILSHGISSVSNSNKIVIGWTLFIASFLFIVLSTFLPGLKTTLLTGFFLLPLGYDIALYSVLIAPTGYELLTIVLSLAVILIWLRQPQFQDYINRWTRDLSTRGLYTAAMVSALLVLGLLPGYITYRFTFHDHSEHLVKYHQLELAEFLQNRQAKVNELMQDTWRLEDGWDLVTQTPALTIHDTYDLVYENLIFRTKKQEEQIHTTEHEHNRDHSEAQDNSEGDLHDSMHGLLGHQIPFLTEASIRMRQLSSQQADRRWISDHETHQLQLMGNSRELITSLLPVPGSWLHPWRFAILLTLLGVLGLIVYRVSRRLFFVHLEHSDPLTLEDLLPKPGDSWKSTIFVGTRSISRQPIFNRSPEIHYIDFIEDIDKDADIKYLLNKPLPGDTKVLCLDHFDHRIDEKERNLYLLECLEKYMAQRKAPPLLILTSRELDDSFLTANISKEKKEEIKHRWDRVLGRFSKLILSDYVSEKPFETFLQIRIIQKINDDLDLLLNSLRRYLRKDHQAENPTNFNESLAELALKTEWLRDELQYLASPNCTLTQKQITTTGAIKKRLEKTLENIKTLDRSIKKERKPTSKQCGWLDKAEESAGNIIEQIDQIVRDPETKKPLPDENRAVATLSPIQFLKNMSIWFLIDSEMEARRVVYRDKKRIKNVCQTLVKECGHHQRLQEIGEQLTYRPDWHTLTEEEVTDLVREGSEAHYKARWSILSHGEQLVAAQLSRGAVVNPKSHQAISRLFARGLIRRSPELRLDNSSFSDFVESTVSEDQLLGWEHDGIPSTWEMIRAPLVIALIVVALFLFWSQREFLGNTIAFLGTIGVGAGAIFNLLSKLGGVTGSPDLKNMDK
ncbi:hypothetical protein [Rhodohalobacter sp. 8-1]|uniref:hypothetical protein n=1 Tax=Rhodohalobacter sp. 8-1 TaxID=3131972 RepID=UPI0030EECFA2